MRGGGATDSLHPPVGFSQWVSPGGFNLRPAHVTGREMRALTRRSLFVEISSNFIFFATVLYSGAIVAPILMWVIVGYRRGGY